MASTNDHTSGSGATFADKLHLAFESVRKPDGTKYTPKDVASGITEAAAAANERAEAEGTRGERRRGCSKTHMYQLLNGETHPSHQLVQEIAHFFGLELEFFANSEAGRSLRDQHTILAALGESHVRQIAHRASQLSPGKIQNVLSFIDFQASQDQADTSD